MTEEISVLHVDLFSSSSFACRLVFVWYSSDLCPYRHVYRYVHRSSLCARMLELDVLIECGLVRLVSTVLVDGCENKGSSSRVAMRKDDALD